MHCIIRHCNIWHLFYRKFYCNTWSTWNHSNLSPRFGRTTMLVYWPWWRPRYNQRLYSHVVQGKKFEIIIIWRGPWTCTCITVLKLLGVPWLFLYLLVRKFVHQVVFLFCFVLFCFGIVVVVVIVVVSWVCVCLFICFRKNNKKHPNEHHINKLLVFPLFFWTASICIYTYESAYIVFCFVFKLSCFGLLFCVWDVFLLFVCCGVLEKRTTNTPTHSKSSFQLFFFRRAVMVVINKWYRWIHSIMLHQ